MPPQVGVVARPACADWERPACGRRLRLPVSAAHGACVYLCLQLIAPVSACVCSSWLAPVSACVCGSWWRLCLPVSVACGQRLCLPVAVAHGGACAYGACVCLRLRLMAPVSACVCLCLGLVAAPVSAGSWLAPVSAARGLHCTQSVLVQLIQVHTCLVEDPGACVLCRVGMRVCSVLVCVCECGCV